MKNTEENSTIFTKREYTQKSPGRKRTGLRITLYLLAACILAGSIFLVQTLLPDPDTQNASSDLLSTEILHLAPEDVASISLQSETPFTLNAQVKDTETSGNTEIIWQLPDIDSDVLDLSATKSYAERFLSIHALRTMTGTNGDYGFSEDGTGVTINMQNGTTHTLQFGDPSLDEIGNYMLLDNTTVYVVDSNLAEQMQTAPTDFADLSIQAALSTEDYAEYVTDGTLTGFDRLEITQKGKPATVITAKKVDGAFQYGIEQPKSAALTKENVQPILTLLQSGLTADAVYHYGIAAPAAPQRTMTYEEFAKKAEYTLVLRLGDTRIDLALTAADENGSHALVCKGKNATYRLSAATVSKWTDLLQ